MKTNLRIAIISIAVLLTAFPIALRSRSQTARVELPKGKWTFSAGPFSNSEHKSMPVDVVKVRTNAAQGLTVENVALVNRSDKDVEAVRLHWYLTEKSQPQILLKGDTEFLALKLQSGKALDLSYPVVSFDKIFRPLMRDGALRGDYRIEVLVTEVRFTDDSKWTFGDPPIRKIALVRPATVEGCQDQGCVWNGEGGSYICSSHSKTECAVASGGQSCTESRCAGDIE